MLRRLHSDQPDAFAFTPANQAWAEVQISKYPEGRQASAIIPLLWRAQEQEGWLSRPAIEHVAGLLGMAYIRALEVATFYFMFQLHPTGSIAHVQVCGTTSCMICGAEDLIAVCKAKIASSAHKLSVDGKFTWEEVECLGACANAPMAQIGKDYYEDLTAERLGEILDELAAGKVPVPGPQNGRYAAEPVSGLTTLKDFENAHARYNASAQLAVDFGDTVKRIDGTEVPLRAPWHEAQDTISKSAERAAAKNVRSSAPPAEEMKKEKIARPEIDAITAPDPGRKPDGLSAPRDGSSPDDLKRIKGVGPKLEQLLHSLGFYHFDQIAAWSEEEVAWVDENLEGFKGRVTRDSWVAQAKALSVSDDS